MIEGKGLGGKKINRVNMSLTNKVDKKLRRLATACNLSHTTLAAMLVEICLNDPQIVHRLQKEFNIYAAYKVVPVHRNGEIDYVMRG